VESLADDGIVFCVFTHHRPWLKERDRAILTLAQEAPFYFNVNFVLSHKVHCAFLTSDDNKIAICP
jgi:hypothetical protein